MTAVYFPYVQVMLPLFWVQLGDTLPLFFLGGSLSLLCALGPAMWHMWIYLGSANANFYYAATLLFGAWQVRVTSVSSTQFPLAKLCIPPLHPIVKRGGKQYVQVSREWCRK